MLKCPICNGNAIGRVGPEQYYCWSCFVEFKDENHVYDVTEDGTLSPRAEEG